MTRFTLNGGEVVLDLPDHATLLHALRGPLGLSSPRFGCGAEQCGSCMVLLDGKPAYACALGLDAVAGRKVVTVEGDPDEDAIRAALDPHLCRCGSHNRIIRAIRRAAQEMAA